MNELVQQDKQQRARALNFNESFIVQAPAGSGKTELIIQRFLTLLGNVKKPEEILAITFTKKSSHEMRSRILKALEHAATQAEPEKEHEKLTWQLATTVLKRDCELNWNLINNPNQLHIKTIDSFCTYLTGQLPLLSHFGSQPDISAHSQTLYREAVLEVLSHVEENHAWSPAVARLLIHTDNDLNRLSNLLIQLLEKRDQWQRYVNVDSSEVDIRNLLSKQIEKVNSYIIQNAVERFPDMHLQEIKALALFAEDNLGVKVDGDELKTWQLYADILLTQKGTWRQRVDESIGFPTLGNLKGEEKKINQAMRARQKTLVGELADDEGLRAALESIKQLPEAHYTDAQWATLKALLKVLKITLAQLRVTFQTYGQIDFIENALGASQALGDTNNPTDLALSLDYQIRHILVDEFQDTSFSQHHLLEMLTHGWQSGDGRTLFVVGDPMQSIYRFRQAEVGLFIRMQQDGIGDIRLTPLTLAVNFRSTSTIVDWNNQHFNAIFPDYSDIGTGAVHYSHSITQQQQEGESHSYITVKGYLQADKQAQANGTIDIIKDTLNQFPNEKIAILVRSRSHLDMLVPALKAAALRYNAVEIDPLIARQSIQDLIALTRALIHPADRIAWLSVLRAPWCGLTLSDLLLLCGKDRHHLICERMGDSNVLATLSQDGQNRLAKVTPILQSAINNRDRTGFRQWIEQNWLALGGPATLDDYAEIGDTDEYFNLLEELACQSPQINLELLNERIKQLRASTHHDDAPIQIMTIHSAKGLEFDTVILPHLEKYNPSDKKSLLLWMEHPLDNDQIALLLAPLHAADSDTDQLYSYIENMQKIKAHFEVDRLLYVATTRAKKRLHLLFNLNDAEKGSSRGSFLHKLWPLIQAKTPLIQADAETTQLHDSTSSLPLIRFIPQWTNPAMIPERSQQSAQQSHNGFKLRDQSARLIGTVAHSIFQQLSISGLDWWQAQNTEMHTSYIKRQLMRAGLDIALHTPAINSIQNVIDRTLRDERGLWILQQREDAASEFAITATTDDGCEQLIIDRTFIDENNIRWIIDYKTGENQDDELSLFLLKQKTKYTEKMGKYRKAIQQIEVRPVKMGLYFPAIPAWYEYEE